MNEFENKPLDDQNGVPSEQQPEVTAQSSVCSCADADVCALDSDPAEDISAVAEAQQDEIKTAEEEEKKEEDPDNFKLIHSMDKNGLRDYLKSILEKGDMEAHREVAIVKQAFFNIKNRENLEAINAYVEAGNDPASFSAEPDEIENELKGLYTEFKERRAAHLAAEEEQRAQNLEKKQEILTRMEEIAADIDNVNTRFSDFKTLQQDFKEIKDVPPTAETEIWRQFQAVVERYYDNLKINKELRDFDFKRNLESKRSLIEEARKLEAVADVIAAFRSLQELHDQWRAIGPVAKEIREELWAEFKEVSTAINKRHQEYFEQRKAAEQKNEEAKTQLCEEADNVTSGEFKNFNDWNTATDKVISIQKKWKEYGFASRKANTALYARFRKICDDFFAAKTAYFQQTREELNKNLAKKTELCERAEALKGETDVKKATDEVVRLQSEWKSIGSVPRKQSDALWQRFTAACNYFFDERKRQGKERHRQETENLEKKQSVIERLSALPKDGDRKEVMPRIKELQAEWNEIGFVPFKVKDKIFAEYRAICDALYDAYNQRQARERMTNFQHHVSELKGDGQKMNRERDRLQRVCDARRNELKTIENNMGFFSIKSNAGNSMLKDMENKLKRLRDEIKELEDKIALVDASSADASK